MELGGGVLRTPGNAGVARASMATIDNGLATEPRQANNSATSSIRIAFFLQTSMLYPSILHRPGRRVVQRWTPCWTWCPFGREHGEAEVSEAIAVAQYNSSFTSSTDEKFNVQTMIFVRALSFG